MRRHQICQVYYEFFLRLVSSKIFNDFYNALFEQQTFFLKNKKCFLFFLGLDCFERVFRIS
jgi:hypothetical protein